MYWLRKRVPDDLRAVVGKLEEKRSLGTKNPTEAKAKLAQLLLELETRWANLRKGARVLTEVEAHEIARPVYDAMIERNNENPGEQRLWNTEIGVEGVWEMPPSIIPAHLIAAYDRAPIMQDHCFQVADELLFSAGLSADEISRKRVARAVSAAMQRACLELKRLSLGGDAKPVLPPVNSRTLPLSSRMSFDQLVSDWAQERKPAKKTLDDAFVGLKRVLSIPLGRGLPGDTRATGHFTSWSGS